MRIVTDRSEIRRGVDALRRELTRILGKPNLQVWDFPGGDGRGSFPTWFSDGSAGPITVAIGPEGRWGTRTPLLLARRRQEAVMTPTVEVNVPVGTGSAQRMINGCLCISTENRFVFAHRGGSFTVTPRKIPKEVVHRYFAKWLEWMQDGDRRTQVIPVAGIGPNLVSDLASFAEEVSGLKSSWSKHAGNEAKVRRTLGWREDLNYPASIERSVSASTKAFTYRHGPLQRMLKEALAKVLPACCRPVLNLHVDVGIVHEKSVLAIFKVKTGLGTDLYSGIGQLLCYRQKCGQPSTKLFLAVPVEVVPPGDKIAVSDLLHSLGIALILIDDGSIVASDRRTLASIAGLIHRQAGH